MRLEFHPDAELELAKAATHYEEHVPGLGERFLAEVERTSRMLLRNSEIGAPIEPELRRVGLARVPFTLYYSVSTDALRIEAVAHQSRRPGYWRSRLEGQDR